MTHGGSFWNLGQGACLDHHGVIVSCAYDEEPVQTIEVQLFCILDDVFEHTYGEFWKPIYYIRRHRCSPEVARLSFSEASKILLHYTSNTRVKIKHGQITFCAVESEIVQ